MGIRLYLDDKRETPEGWVRAYTASACVQILKTQEVDELSLDHDLGHCTSCEGCQGFRSTCGCPCHFTGLTVVTFMMLNDVWPRTKPVVHSQNPVGAATMRAYIDRYWHEPVTELPGLPVGEAGDHAVCYDREGCSQAPHWMPSIPCQAWAMKVEDLYHKDVIPYCKGGPHSIQCDDPDCDDCAWVGMER